MASDFEFDHGNLVKLTCVDGSAFEGMGIDSEIDCDSSHKEEAALE